MDSVESLVFRYKRRYALIPYHFLRINPFYSGARLLLLLLKSQMPTTITLLKCGSDCRECKYVASFWVGTLFTLFLQVKISSKPNHPGIKLGMGLPDIQALVNKAVNLIQERKSDIEVLRKNAEQIKFGMSNNECSEVYSLSCRVEVGSRGWKLRGFVRRDRQGYRRLQVCLRLAFAFITD